MYFIIKPAHLFSSSSSSSSSRAKSECSSTLSNVHSLEHLARGIGQPLLRNPLLVHLLHSLVDRVLALIRDLVAGESETKVIWSLLQSLLDIFHNRVVELVQAQVEMLELRVYQQKPVRNLIAFGVF